MNNDIKKGDVVTNDNSHKQKHKWIALGKPFGSMNTVHAVSSCGSFDTMLDNAYKVKR